MGGYSGTPLWKKLGIKPGFRVKVKNQPVNYMELVFPPPANVVISPCLHAPVDMWHLFTASQAELINLLPKCQQEIKPNGMIWVSWPKISSGVPSEITEGDIRDAALLRGLVDVKVASVDATWSGLKLVIRKELRN